MAESSYTVPFFINGEEVVTSKTFDVRSPATQKVVHQCSSATDTEVQAAVNAAAEAFKTWRKSHPDQRRDIFHKAADIFEKRKEELGQYMMDETGAPRQWADFNINTAKDLLLDVAGRCNTLEGSFPVVKDPESAALVLQEPFGVILAVAPW